jgi:hypothetical protein
MQLSKVTQVQQYQRRLRPVASFDNLQRVQSAERVFFQLGKERFSKEVIISDRFDERKTIKTEFNLKSAEQIFKGQQHTAEFWNDNQVRARRDEKLFVKLFISHVDYFFTYFFFDQMIYIDNHKLKIIKRQNPSPQLNSLNLFSNLIPDLELNLRNLIVCQCSFQRSETYPVRLACPVFFCIDKLVNLFHRFNQVTSNLPNDLVQVIRVVFRRCPH